MIFVGLSPCPLFTFQSVVIIRLTGFSSLSFSLFFSHSFTHSLTLSLSCSQKVESTRVETLFLVLSLSLPLSLTQTFNHIDFITQTFGNSLAYTSYTLSSDFKSHLHSHYVYARISLSLNQKHTHTMCIHYTSPSIFTI